MKKLFSTLLILLLVLSLAGCSRKSEPAVVSQPFVTSPPYSTPAAAESAVAAETPEPTASPVPPEPEDLAEDDYTDSESDSGSVYVTDVYVVELEEGQALGGG